MFKNQIPVWDMKNPVTIDGVAITIPKTEIRNMLKTKARLLGEVGVKFSTTKNGTQLSLVVEAKNKVKAQSVLVELE